MAAPSYTGRLKDLFTGPESIPDSTLGQSQYDFTERKFPLNVGTSSYTGHFMVININVQEKTKFGNVQSSDIIKNFREDLNFNKFEDEYSKTDVLRYNIDSNFVNSSGTPFGEAGLPLSRPRYTNRIKESIALYMPNAEMNFADVHRYGDISFTSIAAQAAEGAASIFAQVVGGITGAGTQVALGSVGATSKRGRAVGRFGAVASVIGQMASIAIQSVESAAARLPALAAMAGSPINPRTEIIFTNTAQREFSFVFMFAPESEEESRALENIIRSLRFHAAPEVGRGLSEIDITTVSLNGDLPIGWRRDPVTRHPQKLISGGKGRPGGWQDKTEAELDEAKQKASEGFIDRFGAMFNSIFYTPPSEFDITFYRRTEGGNIEENTHIPRINTCVLQNIEVSYSPSGIYSTFSNGHPVAVRLTLMFKETEIPHKLRVLQGF